MESKKDQQLDERLAPGCFGAALMYQPEAPECKVCPFAERCAPISWERTERLKLKMTPITEALKAPERARKARNSLDYRARNRTKKRPVIKPSGLELRPCSKADAQALQARLTLWLNTVSNPRARQLAKRASVLIKEKVVLDYLSSKLTREPTPTEFGAELQCRLGTPYSRSKGQKRLVLIGKLEAPGGPWSA